MLEAPIFHVNADDPEAVVFVTRLALKYRLRFRKDVVIDLVCYRRHGHNEADEPAATQPGMYRKIRQHPTARRLYADQLIGAGVLDRAAGAGDARGVPQRSGRGAAAGARRARDDRQQVHRRLERLLAGGSDRARRRPACSLRACAALGERITSFPAGFTLHPRVAQVMTNRKKMLAGELPLDWGCAETLAYAALVEDGSACASPARTAVAAPSFTATPCCTTRTPTPPGSRCSTLPSRSRAYR